MAIYVLRISTTTIKKSNTDATPAVVTVGTSKQLRVSNVGTPNPLPADNWEELGNRDLIPKDRVRLAFNNKDAPYIVFHDANSNSVNVALKENGVWQTYFVGTGGEQLDVDIDPTNFIHIAYIDNMGNVKYVLGQMI